MKTIKLLNLSLKNFKGCKEFDLKLDGHDAKAFADNGAYKTTLYDAFLWNLFGKDSNNRADFAIKTLDEDGNWNAQEFFNKHQHIEVIGNIYQNPNLLEESQ